MAILGMLLDRYYQNQDAEKLKGLMDQYPLQQAGPPQLQEAQGGGFVPPAAGMPGGGLLADRPMDFYLQAATNPAARQAALQGMAGQQAMARQQQEQEYAKNNMTMAQRATFDASQMQQKWENDRRQFEWNTPSAYQQANIAQGQQQVDISRGNLAVNQGQLAMQQQAAAQAAAQKQASPFQQLPPAQQQAVVTKVNTLQNSANALADIRAELATDGGFGIQALSGRSKALQENYAAAVLPIATAVVMGDRTDAPGEADLKRINEMVGDITSVGSRETKMKKLDQWSERLNQAYAPVQRLYGANPLQAQTGQSAFAKSYPNKAGSVFVADPNEFKPFVPKGR